MAVLRGGQEAVTGNKPTVFELGIDLAAQAWQRSGQGDGAIEVAFARAPEAVPKAAAEAAPKAAPEAEWVLLRVAGDPDGRVLVFDRHEWECFLDGARNGEFDEAAARGPLPGVIPDKTL
jgi:hypothetical protein